MSFQHCWICEGWSEHKFVWTIGKSGKTLIKEPVYIHFDFDEYRPWLMNKLVDNDEGDASVYYLYHMIPPGKSSYFYSFGGENGFPENA